MVNVFKKRIEFAWAIGRLSRPKSLLGYPVGNCPVIKGQFLSNLSGIETMMLTKVFDLAEAVIVDHERITVMCLKIFFCKVRDEPCPTLAPL
jgi:hypothetical protein